jgi:hypothetical protein
MRIEPEKDVLRQKDEEYGHSGGGGSSQEKAQGKSRRKTTVQIEEKKQPKPTSKPLRSLDEP